MILLIALVINKLFLISISAQWSLKSNDLSALHMHSHTHLQSREVLCVYERERERLNFAIHFKLLCQRNTPNFIIYFLVTSTRMPEMTEWELDDMPVPAMKRMKLQNRKGF